MTKDDNKISTVVGVMIVKDGKILMGKRKGSIAEGDYALPGGHLELGEEFEDCIIRETKEETGLEIDNIEFLCMMNVKHYMPAHFIFTCFKADWKSGNPDVLEPDKCDGWDWYDPQNLPTPLVASTRRSVDSYLTGKSYYTSKDREKYEKK